MTLSESADWAAIVSTIAAAAGAIFAGWEVYKSRQERKQDIRFMYAQRAVLLTDLLRNDFEKLSEIDKKLACDGISRQHLDLLKSIDFSNLLHEAKICDSLAKASNIKGISEGLVSYLEILSFMKREQQNNLSFNSIAGTTPIDAMVWIYGYEKRENLKAVLGERYVFEGLYSKLVSSIELAYGLDSNKRGQVK